MVLTAAKNAAPADPEAMAFLAMDTRTPCRADFPIPDIGKAVWFAFRWVGQNKQAGPWSDFCSEVVPA